MNPKLRRIIANALIAAPLGWIAGGVSAAQGIPTWQLTVSMQTTVSRPFYVPGEYFGHALGAAALAAVVTWLWAPANKEPSR